MKTVELYTGQAVPLAKSPTGRAQILELRRSNVIVGYLKNGHLIRHTLNAGKAARLIAQEPALLPIDNPLGLAIVRRVKVFDLDRDPRQPRQFAQRKT